jgi:hypothetical protein
MICGHLFSLVNDKGATEGHFSIVHNNDHVPAEVDCELC